MALSSTKELADHVAADQERRPEPACEVSVVIPVYDEAESLPDLYQELTAACGALGRPTEVVFVDDGSTDGSAELLDGIADDDETVTVVHLRRNFGKSAALAAGFERVRGRIVVTLDADLQDDPAMIPEFVRRIDEGADLVSGWKKHRYDPPGKTVPSRIFNAAVRLFSGIQLRDFNCGFKAYCIECIRELSVYGSLHRFLPVLAAERGYRVEELVVNHRPRRHGASKYGARRLMAGFLDLMTVLLLTRFRTRPLHFFFIPGLALGVLGITILSYLTVLWFLGQSIGTRPLLNLGILCTIASTQFMAIGLLSELVVRKTIQPREIFSIREVRRRDGRAKDTSQPRH
jgi:glycosyltransferase involved in cell wall biosynthesis